jgi:signal transduction histidine kinase
VSVAAVQETTIGRPSAAAIGHTDDSTLGAKTEISTHSLILQTEAREARRGYCQPVDGIALRARRHPDAVIAAALLAMGLVEALALADSPDWHQALLTPFWALPLIWRKRWPVVVLALVIAMGPTLDLVDTQGGVMSFVLSAVLASYTLGRALDPPAVWWGPGLILGVGWVFYAATGGALSDFVFVALLYGGAWAVGYAIRRRDLRVGELTSEADELRRGQAERERQAVERERTRIARELHDIVSHSISVIAIQTQAVRRRLGPENAEEIADLQGIETTARQAMTEMRRLLGVLRAQDEAAELSPQPGLDQLLQLADAARVAGANVQLRVEGEPIPLSPGVDLAAFRIVQEAMTNVRKHADSANINVLVRYANGHLELHVDDDGSGKPGRNGSREGGYGLAGMRERVNLYGGTLVAAPRPDGGFHVLATLPLEEAERSGP